MKQKSLLTLALLLCTLFCGCSSDEFSEKDLVADAVYGYEEVFAAIVIRPNEVLTQYKTADTAILDEATADALKEEMKTEIEALCGGDTDDRVYSQYCDMIDRYLPDSPLPQNGAIHWDICVDHGVLDFDAENIEINENTATADAAFVGYDTRIIKQDGKYTVDMTFSQNKCSYELERENGIWRVTAITQNHQEGTASDYDGTKGTYDTFEEAWAASKALSPAEENPRF